MKRLTLEKLSPVQINKINELLRICSEKDPIHLSVPVAEANVWLDNERFFLLYERGQLISMIHLFFPDRIIGELIGFTHPDFRGRHYFQLLLDTALNCAEDLELEQVYLISDGNSPDAVKALDALGLDMEYSEYMLGKRLAKSVSQPDPAAFSGYPAPTVVSDNGSDNGYAGRLTVSETSHTGLTADLFARIFHMDIAQCSAYLEDICADKRIHSYILSLDGRHIGQTQLTFMGDMAYISGFGILPEYRRQGFGLAFLNLLEQKLASESINQLTLQVSSHNKTALSLYRKDGFDVLESLNYHPLFEVAE